MKAIMIVDLPDGFGIPFEDIKTKVILSAKDEDNLEYTLYLKYNDEIKLKPMPSKMKADYDTISSAEVSEKVVAIGWNACIETILGEE